jgi:hypothetical protein
MPAPQALRRTERAGTPSRRGLHAIAEVYNQARGLIAQAWRLESIMPAGKGGTVKALPPAGQEAVGRSSREASAVGPHGPSLQEELSHPHPAHRLRFILNHAPAANESRPGLAVQGDLLFLRQCFRFLECRDLKGEASERLSKAEALVGQCLEELRRLRCER